MPAKLFIDLLPHRRVEEQCEAMLRLLRSDNSIHPETFEGSPQGADLIRGIALQEIVFENVRAPESLVPIHLQYERRFVPRQIPHGRRNLCGNYKYGTSTLLTRV